MKRVVCALCVFLLVGLAFAEKKLHSLATKFSDVILSGMKPGMVYSLRKERNIPYTVANYAESKRDIEVNIQKPNKSQLKENYEAIPDVSWVSVFPSRFDLESGEEMDCDIIISLPADEKYVNRHFQAMIVTESAGKPGAGAIGVGLNFALASRLRFSTGPRPDKIMDEYRQRVFSALQLEISPMSLFVRDALPLGKKAKIDGVNFEMPQVVNKGRESYKLEMALSPKPQEYGLNTEYEALPAEVKVKIKKKKVTSKPRSFTDIAMEIEIPDGEEFYGKKYALVVVGNVQGFDIPIELFGRVYFRTEDKK